MRSPSEKALSRRDDSFGFGETGNWVATPSPSQTCGAVADGILLPNRVRKGNVMRSLWIASACALVGWTGFAGSALAQSGTGPFSGPPGTPGSTAVSLDDSRIVGWATGVAELVRGPINKSDPLSPLASFGSSGNALGPAQGDSFGVVSLGDGGWITLTFDRPIADGAGFDFAVFENGFADNFLELAFVEVSSNGVDFFRFASTSLTDPATQIGSFSPIDTTQIDNLAGKYRQGFGTPFDLAELAGVSALLEIQRVTHVRVRDVVGSIDPLLGTRDALGNLINEPFPTAFASGGFDLDAVAVLNQSTVPEIGSLAAWGIGIGLVWLGRRSRRIGTGSQSFRAAG